MVSFVYLSGERLFNKFYGINCRPKFDTKLLDRFFHRRRQVSPPVNNLRHRFLDGSQHVLYCNVTIDSRHGAVALFIQKINLRSRMGSFRLVSFVSTTNIARRRSVLPGARYPTKDVAVDRHVADGRE